ncbi:MAG: hypothetical protein ACUVUH_03990, partial [bacterium]
MYEIVRLYFQKLSKRQNTSYMKFGLANLFKILSGDGFGEIWGHPHIMDIDNRFKKPNKELDHIYRGQYDLWFEG